MRKNILAGIAVAIFGLAGFLSTLSAQTSATGRIGSGTLADRPACVNGKDDFYLATDSGLLYVCHGGTWAQYGNSTFVLRGAYSSMTSYDANDIVSYSGASYISRVGSNSGNEPDMSPTQWQVLSTGVAFTGGTVPDATYYSGGAPSYDVQCVNNLTTDTAAMQAWVNLARNHPYLGPVTIWGGSAGCAINGTTLDLDAGGEGWGDFLTVVQHGKVAVYNNPILLPFWTKWVGTTGTGAVISFSSDNAALVTNGDSGNHHIFDTGNIRTGVGTSQGVVLENLTFAGDQEKADVHFYGPLQVTMRYCALDNRSATNSEGADVAVDQPGDVSGNGFGLTLWDMTMTTATAGNAVFSDTDTGNVFIGGDVPTWLGSGGISLTNDGTIASMYGFVFENIATEGLTGPFLTTSGGITEIFINGPIHFSDNVGSVYIFDNAMNGAGGTSGYISQNIDDYTSVFAPGSLPIALYSGSLSDPITVSGLQAPTTNNPPSSIGFNQDPSGSPGIVDAANIIQDGASDLCSGSSTITTGLHDQTLTGTLGTEVASSSGVVTCQLYYEAENPFTVGTIYIGGVWAKALTTNGYYQSSPLTIGASGPGTLVLGGFDPTRIAFNDGTDEAWHWIPFVQKVASATGSQSITVALRVDNNTPTVFNNIPVVQKFAAGSISDQEALNRAQALRLMSCPVGTLCASNGQVAQPFVSQTWTAQQNGGTGFSWNNFSLFDNFDQKITTLNPVATSRHGVQFPDAPGGVCLTTSCNQEYVADYFDRSNGALGANYTAVTGQTMPNITGGEVLGSGATVYGAIYSGQNWPSGTTQTSQITVGPSQTTCGGASNADVVGIFFSSSADTGYQLNCANGSFVVLKFVAGTPSLLISTSGDATAGDKLLLTGTVSGGSTILSALKYTSASQTWAQITGSPYTDSSSPLTTGFPALIVLGTGNSIGDFSAWATGAPLQVSGLTIASKIFTGLPIAQDCGTTTTCSATDISSTLKIAKGSVALSSGTPSTAAITGMSPAFTSSSSYACTVTEVGSGVTTNLYEVNYVSASAITITGPNAVTPTVAYVCIGN